jgi:hypothetical protein
MSLNAERWTVIATRPPEMGKWRYEPGYNARNIMVAVDTKRLVTAHKRVANGWQLVAKLAKS